MAQSHDGGSGGGAGGGAGAGGGNAGSPGRGQRPLPDWAGPLRTIDRLDRFEDAVLGYFAERGIEVTMAEGVVHPLRAGQGASDPEVPHWGLGNLLQQCALASESDWPRLVSTHFGLLMNAQQAAERTRLDSVDYNTIAPRLAVRLWDSGTLGGRAIADKLVTREDIPSLVTVLSMDMPEAVRTVPTEEADLWGRSRDDLFARAIANLPAMATPKIDAHEIGDGATIVSVLGDSHYISSLALRLEDFPQLISKHGSFIGLPTRHVMLAVPFGGLDAVKGLQHLILMTRKWCEDGPGSLSPRVWWYRDEVWREIVCELEGNQLNVMPPDELVELLNELGGG